MRGGAGAPTSPPDVARPTAAPPPLALAPVAEPAAPSDPELLAAHVAGDPNAFATLVHRHQHRLWAVALRMMRNPHDAADALQDAYLAAFRRADGFRGEAQVSTWLHRIVVNACLDRLRKQQRQQAEQPLPADPDRTAELVAESAPDPVEQQELRDDLAAALAQLNDDQRVALVLVDVEGYPVDEAAAILGVPAGTVKSRCARGRARLARAAAGPTGGRLMAQPLELSYNWRAPLVFATVALVACLGILVRGQAVGWLSAAVVLVLCWAVVLRRGLVADPVVPAGRGPGADDSTLAGLRAGRGVAGAGGEGAADPGRTVVPAGDRAGRRAATG